MTTSPPRLSKSRFTSGLQCHKKLWWEVHEPAAVELQPDKVLQDLFDQGRLVGQAARTRYPDGVLIDLPYNAYAERIAATSGVNITAAEVLHLNREFRHPDTGELFTSTGVTEQVIAFLPQVQPEIDRQRAMLVGPLPDVPIGE